MTRPPHSPLLSSIPANGSDLPLPNMISAPSCQLQYNFPGFEQTWMVGASAIQLRASRLKMSRFKVLCGWLDRIEGSGVLHFKGRDVSAWEVGYQDGVRWVEGILIAFRWWELGTGNWEQEGENQKWYPQYQQETLRRIANPTLMTHQQYHLTHFLKSQIEIPVTQVIVPTLALQVYISRWRTAPKWE